jgi:hypothetical protein
MYLPDELFKGATELAAYKSASVQQQALISKPGFPTGVTSPAV